MPNIKDGNYWIKESESGACEDGEWKCYKYTNGAQGDQISDNALTSQCKVLCKSSTSEERQIKQAKLDTKVFNKKCKQRKKRQGMMKSTTKLIILIINLNNFSANNTGLYEDKILDMFLNPTKAETTQTRQNLHSGYIINYFETANMSTAYPNLFKLLWHSNIPCFGSNSNYTNAYLLKKCIWQGEEYNCSDLFQQVPTDSGTQVNRNKTCYNY